MARATTFDLGVVLEWSVHCNFTPSDAAIIVGICTSKSAAKYITGLFETAAYVAKLNYSNSNCTAILTNTHVRVQMQPVPEACGRSNLRPLWSLLFDSTEEAMYECEYVCALDWPPLQIALIIIKF
jgi:hypothetical protein